MPEDRCLLRGAARHCVATATDTRHKYAECPPRGWQAIKMKATVREKQDGDVPKAPPGEYEGSDVRQLDAAQFKSEVHNGDTPHLVASYAPWCGP